MNLIRDSLIPVMGHDGGRLLIRPSEITKVGLSCVDSGRADFDVAFTEYLIGLLQTCMAPETDAEWQRLYRDPPSEGDLVKAFQSAEGFFDVDGETTRFKQLSPAGKTFPIFSLFLEGPGDITVKQGRDFLEKAGRITKVCPTCAIGALMARHSFSGVGGASCVKDASGARLKGYGYSASFRTRNKFATCILYGETLWETLWLNVTNRKDLSGDYRSKPYPWAGGENGKHPCWGYWETGWSTWLNFEQTEAECDCCNSRSAVVVRSYNKNGVKSEENKGSHPLAVNTAKIGGIYTLTYPRCLGLFKQKDHSCVVFAVAQRRKAVPRRAKFFGVKLDQATYIGTAEVFADLPQSSDAFQWVEQLMKLRNSFGGILGWDFAEELMRASEKPFRGLVATGDKGVFCSRMVEEAIRVTLAADPEFGERNKIAGKMKKFCAVFGCDVNVEIPVSQTPQFSRKYRGAIGLGWWMKLISEWKTSERSELRRRSTLDEIKNPETRRAYDQLWQEYNDAAVEDFGGIGLTEAQTDNITTLALALAHVKEHVKGESFFTTANRFGIRVGVDGRIKFHQVFEVIRRAGYRINVGSLSQELYFWNSKSRG